MISAVRGCGEVSSGVATAWRTAAGTSAGRVLERVWRRGSATPDRLRRVGAVLVIGCLLTALVSLLGAVSRAGAVRDGDTRIAALTSDAAALYQSLADADAMATSGYVSGGLEPAAVRARYDEDIARASDRLVHAAGQLPEGDPAVGPLATIAGQLPVYTALIETARTYNRQGLPLGQSYLDSASRTMRTSILPAAEELRRIKTAELESAYQRGGAIPIAVLLIGMAVLAGVVDVAVAERRRTNRILNTGLVAAGTALALLALWWIVVALIVGDALGDARSHSVGATALDDARVAVAQARSNESLVLVARSGGSSSSDQGFSTQLDRVLGVDGNGGLLADAAAQATDPESTARVDAIRVAAVDWQEAHRRVRELDDGGNYPDAVASVVGAEPGGSGATFQRLDTALAGAVDAERAAFADEVGYARAAQTGLTVIPTLLALFAAIAVAVGIGRRVGEYR